MRMHIGMNRVRAALSVAVTGLACSGAQTNTDSALAKAPQPTTSSPAAGAARPDLEPSGTAPATISKVSYGQVGAQDVELYRLENANGLVMKVATYGAIITELHVPDKAGRRADIVLGFDTLDGYVQGNP